MKTKRKNSFGKFIGAILATTSICTLLSSSPILSTSVATLAATPSASEWEVLSAIDRNVLSFQARLVAVDRRNGGINENRDRFMSVGLQRHSSKFIAYGILIRDKQLVETGIEILEYAFAHQSADGSFPSFLPEGPEGIPRSVAFFFQDLGHSLLLCQNSDWFQQSPETANLRSRLNKLMRPTENSLNWLMTEESELKKHERVATNRIFFSALAYYLVGKALNRSDAMKIGESFVRLALKQQAKAGYFLENGGSDSSYNGVSLQNALVLYTNLDPNAVSLKQALWHGIERGVNWQLGYFLPDGQVSTVGNSRVGRNGESFLGKKKFVDYPALFTSLNYYAKISGDANVQGIADRTFAFYKGRKESAGY